MDGREPDVITLIDELRKAQRQFAISKRERNLSLIPFTLGLLSSMQKLTESLTPIPKH